MSVCQCVVRFWIGVCVGIVALSSSNAIADIYGRAKVASKYVFRGLDQSAGNPVMQAGIDYKWSSGAYVGSWASMVEGGQKRNLEFNHYMGRMVQVSSLVLDMGIQNYDYHNVVSNVAKTDIYIGGYSKKWGGTLNWDLEDPETAYIRLRREFKARNEVRVSVAAGRQFYKSYGFDNAPDNIKDYTDILIRAEKEMIKGLFLGADYTAIRGRNESQRYIAFFIEINLE